LEVAVDRFTMLALENCCQLEAGGRPVQGAAVPADGGGARSSPVFSSARIWFELTFSSSAACSVVRKRRFFGSSVTTSSYVRVGVALAVYRRGILMSHNPRDMRRLTD
jgi:hypothetical protein